RITVIDTKSFRVRDTLQDDPPGTKEGSAPNALALSADGKVLYAAEADNNAVAVFQLSADASGISSAGKQSSLIGRIPVGWYPVALQISGERLFVVNGKGRGTRANPSAAQNLAYALTPTEYVLGQLNGTITEVRSDESAEELRAHSARVSELNGWNTPRPETSYPPFKHVLYI